MTEKPILFKPELVRAILDGKKTMTRRLVDMNHLRVRLPQALLSDFIGIIPSEGVLAKPAVYKAGMNPHGAVYIIDKMGDKTGVKPGEFHFECPYADGDTALVIYFARHRWTIAPIDSYLWVRETWRRSGHGKGGEVFYAADFSEYDRKEKGPWKPGIHMRRVDCRLRLQVISVRLEHLQDISEEDAKAEGVEPADCTVSEWCQADGLPIEKIGRGKVTVPPYKLGFMRLWDKINGERASWASNPWVWVLSFRRA